MKFSGDVQVPTDISWYDGVLHPETPSEWPRGVAFGLPQAASKHLVESAVLDFAAAALIDAAVVAAARGVGRAVVPAPALGRTIRSATACGDKGGHAGEQSVQ
jgi:hypothetical protein